MNVIIVFEFADMWVRWIQFVHRWKKSLRSVCWFGSQTSVVALFRYYCTFYYSTIVRYYYIVAYSHAYETTNLHLRTIFGTKSANEMQSNNWSLGWLLCVVIQFNGLLHCPKNKSNKLDKKSRNYGHLIIHIKKKSSKIRKVIIWKTNNSKCKNYSI